jgi:hypothetical protein
MPRVLIRRFLIFSAILLAGNTAQGQNETSGLESLYEELDSLFADESIPGNLFELADSILAIEDAKVSAVLLRAGYVSEVVSAGRSFGIDQYGFSPAINYFHHSGLGASITGYWSSEYSPSYYLTDLSVSYNRNFLKDKLSVLVNHDFYFYNDSLDDHSFSKSAQGSLNYHFKHLDIGADYGYLYGNESAHRIVAHANGTFKLRLQGLIDAVSFMPGVAFQWGNADVLYWRQPRTALSDLYWLIRNNDYPLLGRREYLKLAYLLESDRELAATYFLRQHDYTTEEIESLFEEYYANDYRLEDTFGFMNLSISIPVIVRAGKFSLLMNYTWNKPHALPGEDFTFESNSYFSSSLSYMISWVKK